MRNILLLSLLIGLIGSMGSCKKESNTDKLTGESWKLTSLTVSPGIQDPFTGTTITDFYNSTYYPACIKDNFITFIEDGTSIADEGSEKCDPTDPQTTEGTWNFNSDETQLILDAGTEDEFVYTIEQLSSSKLKFSSTEVDTDTGINHTYTFTMEPK